MSYGAEADWWNDSLAAWFFNDTVANELVYLGVDDEELQRAAAAAGGRVPNARTAFTAAMRQASSPNNPFGYWGLRTRRWEQLARPRPTPPFIGVLALTALIADDATRSRSSGLYDALAEVLSADPTVVRSHYEETVRRWWGLLGQWLLEHEGRFGLPTAWAPDSGFRSIIGHAWSQVLVRRRDRMHFAEFFSSLGAPHGPELALDVDRAPGELFVRWRTWVRRGGHVSERLRHLVDDPVALSTEEGRLLARVLMDELCHWDGAVRDPDRRRSLQLAVIADTVARRPLYFAAVVTAELAGSEVDFPAGAVMLDDEGDLTEVPVPVTTIALASGVRLECSGITLSYSPRPVVPMARRVADLWHSVEHLQPGEEAYALVAQSEVAGFKAMAPHSTPSTAVSGTPDGWGLFKDAEVATDIVAPSAGLASLLPRASALPYLKGGLRLHTGRKYLLGGPPDVLVPEAEGIITEVVVDGQVIANVPADGGIVRLATLGLCAGDHSVVAGCRRFNVTLEPFDWWHPPVKPLLTRTVVGARGGQASVSGAVVDGVSQPPLLLVPVQAEIVVLGRPGECHRTTPACSPWVRATGLAVMGFEPLDRHAYESGRRPFFPYWVAWMLPAGDWHVMPCAGEPELRHVRGREAVEKWAGLVHSIRHAVVVGDDRERRWWASYLLSASSVIERCHA